ncbi:MAG TPA: DUF2330 domain-containing protein [Ktedonobacterales bacterium]|nr:DUF2330 domain-containing protein [Ktedonobacterales bacterium]
MRRLAQLLLPTFLAVGALLTMLALQAEPALACGSLVAPNGAVRLARATTLVAWHGGIEHYMTAFTYQGDVSNLGWIVPLPAVPTKIEEGGAWTLQRLQRETHPLPKGLFAAGVAEDTANSAQVLQQVQVEALDITVLKGSGQEVIEWCRQNTFVLDEETSAHLLRYAQGSPIFMAAKYNTERARARGQLQGDGAPVLITMPTKHLWVPLEVLALDGQPVEADLYLLTDNPVNTSEVGALVGQSPVGTQVPGAPGFTVAFQERMNESLYHDLSTDRNGSWVPRNAWLTYLTLDSTEPQVTYDLGISSSGVIRLAPFGTKPDLVAEAPQARSLPSWLPQLPIGTPQIMLTLALLLACAGAIGSLIWRHTRLGVAQHADGSSAASRSRQPQEPVL